MGIEMLVARLEGIHRGGERVRRVREVGLRGCLLLETAEVLRLEVAAVLLLLQLQWLLLLSLMMEEVLRAMEAHPLQQLKPFF